MMVNGIAGLSLYHVSKVRVLEWFLGIMGQIPMGISRDNVVKVSPAA